MQPHHRLSVYRLAAYLALWHGHVAVGEPLAQHGQARSKPTHSVTPVTSAVTKAGSTVVATFTPTSLEVSGLEPPITAATTITTTDSKSETVLVAIAAGAGIVAGAALAAWVFPPKAATVPPPSEPPSYPTKTQRPPKTTTEEPTTTATTSTAPACPLYPGLPSPDFAQAPKQPQWTAAAAPQETTYNHAKCTRVNSNGQLLHDAPPDFMKELADVFCAKDLSQSREESIGKDDLPDDSTWKRPNGPAWPVKFTFDAPAQAQHDCANDCKKAFNTMILDCETDSHYFNGKANLKDPCGSYAVEVEGERRTKLTCAGAGDDPLVDYMYRDAAIDAIEDFCTAQAGKTLKQKDKSTFPEEDTFSIVYADTCAGSGTYTVDKDLCMKYLRRTVDECDTDDISHKHGGTLQDVDNCGQFNLHPHAYDIMSCYPQNAGAGLINGGSHTTVSQKIAVDAINAFCDRSGDGQKYTLDPAILVDDGGFIANACTENGMAYCGYFYMNDGTRVTSDTAIGDIYVRLEAKYYGGHRLMSKMPCGPQQVYEIHGERCKQMLGRFTGLEAIDRCVGDDTGKLDLGSFVESGDKGCVLWNMWAVATH